MAVVFRYGVVVLIGLDTLAEDEVLRGAAPTVGWVPPTLPQAADDTALRLIYLLFTPIITCLKIYPLKVIRWYLSLHIGGICNHCLFA